MNQYDYIIAGTGCAGFSLLMRMIASGKLADKRILIVDKEPKFTNDRTWCFWEQEPDIFESVVYRQWDRLYVHTNERSSFLKIDPYRYKMIRGIDFYNHCFKVVTNQPNIDMMYSTITDISTDKTKASITASGDTYTADYVFSSIMPDILPKQDGRHYLLQHFKGWIIETDRICFGTDAATLMDFRVPQQEGAGFVYVLPLAGNKAMIEYTLFSKQTLSSDEYDDVLWKYIKDYYPGVGYGITAEEYGVIPMTNHNFKSVDGRIINIGTAGGQTKPSSGYTFKFIQEHTQKLVDRLVATGDPYLAQTANSRFLFYDTVLLRVLSEGRVPPDEIFGKLFNTDNPQRLLRFLDNSSTPQEEVQIISSLPTLPFLRAAAKEIKSFLRT
ncbi:MAG: lycopene cyclase [Sphingobacteriales bacterium]|nr:MAG: lycopene cyclase [Sphingobacteriales bacterium]